ncbi:SGNH/GDSL hydrolase family protein [Pseudodesulfovibrio cashew]|uniref:SGNH/GDSL hydrolase family protein n=1 Tax=Pseudodesulfovibrio cashew TaxID=2678688 RepID=A0A6I6JFI2_9BACT|nr:SGNH/GDSL hydrolase family protein [Pseudodesulfovibrio cashew]QGY41586.1 SGNH/GDSL hydrolase family protein [Pseudodesulfovibrio cashew]
MILFLGNCQADFPARALSRRGHDCAYKVLASPLTYTSHPGEIPLSLAGLAKTHGLDDYLHGRKLSHQFAPVDGSAPDLIVLSLFHENTPLFVHNEEGYIFFMDPRALTDKPEMMAWTQTHCRMFKPNPATYLERYGTMLARLRLDNPDVPVLILSRLSHFPAFGPDPFSYLEGWDELWRTAPETFKQWAHDLDNVHVLELDRIFGGIWSDSEKRIESLCPFLKIKLEETNGEVTGLHAQRDIEHIGPMPDRLAKKIEQFLETGKISYEEKETVPTLWRRQWRPARLDMETMLEKLRSGANYQGAEAVAGFFLDLGRDYTDLLVQAGDRMPVCHMTLHMVKAYGRIHRNPALAQWCDAQRKSAENFTANGPLYREAYIKRLEGMKRYALGGMDE